MKKLLGNPLVIILCLVWPVKLAYDSGGLMAVVSFLVLSLLGWGLMLSVEQIAIQHAVRDLELELRKILMMLYTSAGCLPKSLFPVNIRELGFDELIVYARAVSDDQEYWSGIGERIGLTIEPYVTEPRLLDEKDPYVSKADLRKRLHYILSVFKPPAEIASEQNPHS